MALKDGFFQLPADDAKLWRYIDLSKLVSLLATESLFFARADQLSDTWEGATTKSGLDARRQNLERIPAQTTGQITGLGVVMSDIFQKARKHTYLSCWHENQNESAAMWKLYVNKDEGVAVQTTFANLKATFAAYCDQRIEISKVHYDLPYPPDNTLKRFFWKRPSFEHEHEVRAAIQDSRSFDEASLAEDGLLVPAVLDNLIEAVYLAPTSPRWFKKVVQSLLDRFGLLRRVHQSSLAEDPIY